MLFKRPVLDGIADGTISLAFRRWARPRVQVGSRLRTAVGVLEVDAIDRVDVDDVTAIDARHAGFSSRDDLLRALDQRADGSVYRVQLHRAGSDPRVALRGPGARPAAARGEVQGRLARLDATSRHGSWTRTVLRLIRDRPGVRAADLAPRAGSGDARVQAGRAEAQGARPHREPRGRVPAVAPRTRRP